MSQELTVVPFHFIYRFNLKLGLQFDRSDYDKFEDLVQKSTEKRSCDFLALEDSTTELDCYGNPLRQIDTETFLALYTIDKPTTWDEANLAFLKKLGPGHPLLLYFH